MILKHKLHNFNSEKVREALLDVPSSLPDGTSSHIIVCQIVPHQICYSLKQNTTGLNTYSHSALPEMLDGNMRKQGQGAINKNASFTPSMSTCIDLPFQVSSQDTHLKIQSNYLTCRVKGAFFFSNTFPLYWRNLKD